MIGQNFEFKNGLNKEKEFFGHGTPIINFMDVYHLTVIRKKNINGFVELSDKEIANFSVRKGDVFFTRTSETINDIGMSATLVEDIENCVFSGFVLRARPVNKKLDNLYKSYCFSIEPVRKEIVTKSSYTTRALTSGRLLNKVCFYCPSDLQEQQKIATFLSSVDTKIELLGKKKALLEQYKKGMMQKLFTKEIRFEDEQGNDYPDWEERRFDEMANIIMGTSPKSSAYNHSMEGLPLIQGNADVKNRRSAPRIYTSEITKECLPNDTLLSVRAPVGEVSRAIHHACIGRGISAVRVKAIALQDYIFHYLVWYEPKWKGLSQGSTFESVNTKSIESLEILVPSKLEQQKIADFLSAIDKKIELIAEQLEQARTFKKGLLQQMFI